MSDKVKIYLNPKLKTYIHPDGRFFRDGIEYLADKDDATDLVGRTDERGEPYFVTTIKSKKKQVVEEDIIEETTRPAKEVKTGDDKTPAPPPEKEPVITHKKPVPDKKGSVKIIHKDSAGLIDTGADSILSSDSFDETSTIVKGDGSGGAVTV